MGLFTTIRNAWKIADLRKKMFFTLLMIFIFRLGSFIPVPGLNPDALKSMVDQGTIFGFFNILSGGAFENATIFAMSITPYINASIIIQLLTVAIPKLEALAKEGEEGRKLLQNIRDMEQLFLDSSRQQHFTSDWPRRLMKEMYCHLLQ